MSVGDLESSQHRLSFAQLDADTFRLRSSVAPGSEVGLRSDDASVVLAALVALDGWATRVHLLPATVEVDLPTIDGDELVSRPTSHDGEPGLARAPGEEPDGIETRWVVYTSGTTGVPKAIDHTLSTLGRTVRAGRGDNFVWGLLYDPNRMAGLQVLLQVLLTRASLVAPDLHLALPERVAALRERHVDALSATPTLWRQILQTRESHGWPLRQITLGGEIADQVVLSALAARFPDARIVHIFAATETGAAFSVTDGVAGFPASYLIDAPRGIALDVRDGELYVHAPGVAVAGPDGFVGTGDRVEVIDGRVLFKGRDTGVVNVGGANVWPEEVESILREHPDVDEAVVSSTPNALAGNLLVAHVVLADLAERQGVKKRLRSWVRDRAPGTHVPATVTVVDHLDISSAGKVQR